MHRRIRRFPWLAALGGLATGVALVLSVSVVISTHTIARHNCQQIELLKARLRTVVRQSEHDLGRPGRAGYGYYRTHPDELAQARVQAADVLRRFAASRCH